MKTKVSVVIISNNEEQNIGRAIRSVLETTDDIVVVDSFSTDQTIEICRQLGANVFQKEFSGYGDAKNFGAQKAKYPWILSLDADEALSPELSRELLNMEFEDNVVYKFDRLNSFLGSWIHYGGWYPDWKPRVYQRDSVQWDLKPVHEELVIPGSYKERKLKGKLFHYTCQDLQDYKTKLDRYARLSAQQSTPLPKFKVLILQYLSPAFKFVKTYIFQLGFLDGKAGFIISKLNAWTVFKKYQFIKKLSSL
jgi:glycosyltransferase involved in cell wall biosynthesis